MNPTLLVLAAGMGSRYGGLKQLDPMGPNGETILDYSVLDARRAGFGKVVFVIRQDFESEFREKVGRNYEGSIEVGYVFQQLDSLPTGLSAPAGREKPWGTTHAIWCARDAMREPFAAINADDFYGADPYRKLAGFLNEAPLGTAHPLPCAMVAFRLGNTLSEHGTVSRGVCEVNAEGLLRKVEECTAIEKTDRGARQKKANGEWIEFTGNEPVSMNFWGFTPAIFDLLEKQLVEFLKTKSADPKAECYIPSSIAALIESGDATVQVLPTESAWFGITYREDKPQVMAALRRLTETDAYPAQAATGISRRV